MSMGNNR